MDWYCDMGGANSGRWGGRSLVENSKTIDLMYMVRSGRIKDSLAGAGSIIWTLSDDLIDAVNYSYDLRNAEAAFLRLVYIWQPTGHESRNSVQHITMTHTKQNYGGKRWWALCPKSGQRVAKLHCPPGQSSFASREAWKLGYRSQRIAHSDRPFEKLFSLQCKLESNQVWGCEPVRPKGMWNQTFERHLELYRELDEACGDEMIMLMRKLGVVE